MDIKCSADKLSYTKTFGANDDYTTNVEDMHGNVATVRIIINQIKDEAPFVVTIEYKKNDDNTVTAIMKSNVELKYTKPSWTLSEDKLTYTKTFGANDTYTTDVEDIYGNVITVTIEITQIDDKGPNIQLEYIYDSVNNNVTVTMKSNEILKDTKPSWTLSDDKLSYTKTFGANDTYTTDVEDINGNVTTVTIQVTQIDDKGPNIQLEYIYNTDGTTTVIMHSNEVLAHTKPSWTLSEDKLNYTKTFGADDEKREETIEQLLQKLEALKECPGAIPIEDYEVRAVRDYTQQIAGYDILLRMKRMYSLQRVMDETIYLDEAEVIEMASEIASILKEAHAKGIIHGNIKPSNIFIQKGPDNMPVYYLADFASNKIRGI